MPKKQDVLKGSLFKALFILLCFSYSLAIFAKTIVISDIDDTLKKANSVGSPIESAYHFLKKEPYLEMRDLFLEMKSHERNRNEDISFYYVSAAYGFTFNADKWIYKYNFPNGRTVLKTKKNHAPTYEFKYAEIKKIIEEERTRLDVGTHEELHFYMFGDNSQFDGQVYHDLTRDMGLDSHIYIRDVRAEATFFDSTLPVKRIEGVNYFFSEIELFLNPQFDFLSDGTKARAFLHYQERSIVPEYTYKTLYKRLLDIYGDKDRAKGDADKFWNDYYLRF